LLHNAQLTAVFKALTDALPSVRYSLKRFLSSGGGGSSSSSSKGKGKAIPVKAWRGPEGSRRLRIPNFKTIGT